MSAYEAKFTPPPPPPPVFTPPAEAAAYFPESTPAESGEYAMYDTSFRLIVSTRPSSSSGL